MMKTYFLVFVLATLAGCSNKYQSFCEAAQQCRGGNDKDIDACVEASNADEDVAKAYDCNDAFEKLADCRIQKSTCTMKQYGTADCNAENVALSACRQGATAKK
jgi:hypothetical protein